jgi:hypothetical protein
MHETLSHSQHVIWEGYVWQVAESDKELMRYLLGQLPVERRDRLEEHYFEDDTLHEKLLAIEDELIDAYLLGDLSADDNQSFENFFLRSPERSEKVRFARSLHQFTEREIGSTPKFPILSSVVRLEPVQPSPAIEPMTNRLGPVHGRQQVNNILRDSGNDSNKTASRGLFNLRFPFGFAMAFAASALILVSAIIWVSRTRREVMSAEQTEPSNIRHETTASPPPVASFVLFPYFRGSSEENTVSVPAGPHTIELKLALQSDEYRSYRFELRDSDGKKIIETRDLKSQVMKDGTHAVTASFPSNLIPAGDYSLRLEGETANHNGQPVGGYGFRVKTEEGSQNAPGAGNARSESITGEPNIEVRKKRMQLFKPEPNMLKATPASATSFLLSATDYGDATGIFSLPPGVVWIVCRIPTGTHQLEFMLRLVNDEFPTYRVALGRTPIYTLAPFDIDGAKSMVLPTGLHVIRFHFSSDQLQDGDYAVSLSGESGHGWRQPLGTYFFRVEREEPYTACTVVEILNYQGPHQGEMFWTGTLGMNEQLTIQGAPLSGGVEHGDASMGELRGEPFRRSIPWWFSISSPGTAVSPKGTLASAPGIVVVSQPSRDNCYNGPLVLRNMLREVHSVSIHWQLRPDLDTLWHKRQ